MSPALVAFDGLVGPTHNHAGLSPGNLASMRRRGASSSPRAAALEGLAKMRVVLELGGHQAVLPPHERPHTQALRELGFSGPSEEAVVVAAAREAPLLVALVSSASAMWAANAATVVPSCDARDGRVQLVPANLAFLAHRSLEVDETRHALEVVFPSRERFVVSSPVPSAFGDEGAANHVRLAAGERAMHVFGWGRSSTRALEASPTRFAARQSLEASQAVARKALLSAERVCFAQQHPLGIDAGAFHTDVLVMSEGAFLCAHELAFARVDDVRAAVEGALGEEARVRLVSEAELPVAEAIASYVFNGELVPTPAGLVLLAPTEVESHPRASALVDALVDEGHLAAVRFVHLGESMQGGGGPACLRLRVPLTLAERASVLPSVMLDEPKLRALEALVARRWPERLSPSELGDPALVRECLTALDELTRLLGLGSSFYAFQRR